MKYAGNRRILLAISMFGTQLFLNSAKGVILMAGLNVGIQALVRISRCLGVNGYAIFNILRASEKIYFFSKKYCNLKKS